MTLRPTKVVARLIDGPFRHLRQDGLGPPECQWAMPRVLRLEIGPHDGLVPATCLWCAAALVRSP